LDAAGTEPMLLSVDQSLELLGPEHHDWVRHIMQGQLRDALAFVSVRAGSFPDEERARAASVRLLALHRELSEAFPLEDWYAIPAADQGTINALIAQRSSPITALSATDCKQPAPWWLRTLAGLVADAMRRPRSRWVLRTLHSAGLERLPRAADVKDEVLRKLSDEGEIDDQPCGEMLAVSL
jgi:hypothetical protein